MFFTHSFVSLQKSGENRSNSQLGLEARMLWIEELDCCIFKLVALDVVPFHSGSSQAWWFSFCWSRSNYCGVYASSRKLAACQQICVPVLLIIRTEYNYLVATCIICFSSPVCAFASLRVGWVQNMTVTSTRLLLSWSST